MPGTNGGESMDTQTGGAKPSKPLGIIVAVVMLSYALYALYTVIKVKTCYKKEAVGVVKNIEASFVPGNKVYVSQFSNIVTYEFFAGGPKGGTDEIDMRAGENSGGSSDPSGHAASNIRDGRTATKKIYSARIDSLMMCTKKTGDEITVYYDETAPEKFNIPALALYGDVMLFIVLGSIGSTLMWYMLKM